MFWPASPSIPCKRSTNSCPGTGNSSRSRSVRRLDHGRDKLRLHHHSCRYNDRRGRGLVARDLHRNGPGRRPSHRPRPRRRGDNGLHTLRRRQSHRARRDAQSQPQPAPSLHATRVTTARSSPKADALADVNKDEEAETKPRVYVTGEVQKPGPYILRPSTNVVQALTQAGGPGIYAASRRIQIHRKIQGADSILLFDYNAYQAGTVSTDNINLRSGDIIIVPERGLLE